MESEKRQPAADPRIKPTTHRLPAHHPASVSQHHPAARTLSHTRYPPLPPRGPASTRPHRSLVYTTAGRSPHPATRPLSWPPTRLSPESACERRTCPQLVACIQASCVSLSRRLLAPRPKGVVHRRHCATRPGDITPYTYRACLQRGSRPAFSPPPPVASRLPHTRIRALLNTVSPRFSLLHSNLSAGSPHQRTGAILAEAAAPARVCCCCHDPQLPPRQLTTPHRISRLACLSSLIVPSPKPLRATVTSAQTSFFTSSVHFNRRVRSTRAPSMYAAPQHYQHGYGGWASVHKGTTDEKLDIFARWQMMAWTWLTVFDKMSRTLPTLCALMKKLSPMPYNFSARRPDMARGRLALEILLPRRTPHQPHSPQLFRCPISRRRTLSPPSLR